MANDLGLTRSQLRQFLPNHQAVVQFEKLFEDVTALQTTSPADNVASRITSVSESLNELRKTLELALLAPPISPSSSSDDFAKPPLQQINVPQNDVAPLVPPLTLPDDVAPPPQIEHLERLPDVSAFNPTDNDVLSYVASTGKWTASDAVTANLTNTQTTLLTSSATLTDGAGANTGTLTNAPTAGNPTKWVPIDDNGTIRYIPAW